MIYRYYTYIVVATLTLTLLGCGKNSDTNTRADKLSVYVSIEPVAFLVGEIAGDKVSVKSLIPPGQDPHLFAPSPQLIADLSKADIFFKIGLPFESNVTDKISSQNKNIVIVDGSAGIKKRKMSSHIHHEDYTHSHNNVSVEVLDPHIWLGPQQLLSIASNIKTALIEADPVNEDYYQEKYQTLCEVIKNTDKINREKLKPFKGRKVFVFHPAFGYFMDAYGLEQRAVEIDGKSPSPRQLISLISSARKENVKILFVQPQFDPKSAKTIADAIGGDVVPMDPLNKNVIKNLQEIADKVEKALRQR